MPAAHLRPARLAQPVPVLKQLTQPYTGKRVFEQSPAGTPICTLRDRTGGGNVVITSVVDMLGTTTSNEFAVTPDGVLTCGTTPLTWSWTNFWRKISFREYFGPQQRDTVLYVSILQLGYAGAGAFNDNFDGTDGAVRLRTGWTTTTETGSNANQDQVATVGGIIAYTTASNSSNITQVSYNVNTPNFAVQFNAVGAFGATTNSCPRVYLKYVTGSTHNLYFQVSSTNNISFGGRMNGVQLSSTSYAVNTHPDGTGGLKNGDLIRVEHIGNKLYLYVRGWPTPVFTYDVPALSNGVLPSVPTRVMFSSNNGGVSTAYGYDNLVITPLSVLAIDTTVQPVFAMDRDTRMGCVPVSGQLPTTGTPAAMAWPLKYAVGGGIVPGYDWRNLTGAQLDSATGLLTFRGFISAPAGGMYIAEFADAANTSNVVATTSFGVGFIWLGYGQSNMANMRDYTHTGANDNYPGLGWTILYKATQDTAYFQKWNGIQPMVSISNILTAATGLPVLVVNYAKGTQSAASLSPGASAAPNNYFELLRDVVLRIGGTISMLNINQGEAEAPGNPILLGNNSWPDTWMNTESTLLSITGCRRGEYPVFWSYIKGCTSTSLATGQSQTAFAGHLTMRACVERLITLQPNYYLSHHPMDCDYEPGTDPPNTAQVIHIAAADYHGKLGPRYTRNGLRWWGFSQPSQLGPIARTVVAVDANTTDIYLDPNGAESLTFDAGTLTGFQVIGGTTFGGTTPAQMAAVSNVAPDTANWKIRLTHAAIATAQRTVRYPVSTAIPIGGTGVAVYDANQMFGQPYTDAGGQAAAPQIKGVYQSGSYNIGLCVMPEKISG